MGTAYFKVLGGLRLLTHDQFWPSITILNGRELKTLMHGRPFEVIDVNGKRVLLAPAASGKPRIIRRGILERAFGVLMERRELTSQEIAQGFSPFNAVYIAALLAALPDVAVCTSPIRLIFVGHQLFYLE